MRSLFCFAALGIVALAATGNTQEPKKEPAKAEITKAAYLVKGMH